jgi:hypothetical protein
MIGCVARPSPGKSGVVHLFLARVLLDAEMEDVWVVISCMQLK